MKKKKNKPLINMILTTLCFVFFISSIVVYQLNTKSVDNIEEPTINDILYDLNLELECSLREEFEVPIFMLSCEEYDFITSTTQWDGGDILFEINASIHNYESKTKECQNGGTLINYSLTTTIEYGDCLEYKIVPMNCKYNPYVGLVVCD